MIIVSYGITKSGSTLAFETLKGCLIEAGFPQRKLPQAVLKSESAVNYSDFKYQTEEILDLLLDEVAPDERIVIKTHGFLPANQFERVSELIKKGKVLVQISHRDPRDISLSMLDAGRAARKNGRKAFSKLHAIDDTIAELRKQLNQLSSWSDLPNTLHVEYEELAFSPDQAIPRISGFLGVSATPEYVLKYTTQSFTQQNKMKRRRYRREMPARDRKLVVQAAHSYILENNYLTWFEKLRYRRVLRAAEGRSKQAGFPIRTGLSE